MSNTRSGPAHVVPADSCEALDRLLMTADELLASVQATTAQWHREHPEDKLVREWNAYQERYEAERDRFGEYRLWLLDLGAMSPERRARAERELARLGNIDPNTTPPYVQPVRERWRSVQKGWWETVAYLKECQVEALRIGMYLPDQVTTV